MFKNALLNNIDKVINVIYKRDSDFSNSYLMYFEACKAAEKNCHSLVLFFYLKSLFKKEE